MTVLTKAKIDIKNGLIELEGSEEFVSESIKLYSELLSNNKYEHKQESQISNCPTTIAEPIDEEMSENEDRFIEHFGVTENEINNIIHIESDYFKIITNKIKGSTSERQIAYCLLYCLTKEFYGQQKADNTELRALCEEFACLDSGNFTAHIKRKKNWFIIEGTKNSKNSTIKLTVPGKEEARKIIKNLIFGSDK